MYVYIYIYIQLKPLSAQQDVFFGGTVPGASSVGLLALGPAGNSAGSITKPSATLERSPLRLSGQSIHVLMYIQIHLSLHM